MVYITMDYQVCHLRETLVGIMMNSNNMIWSRKLSILRGSFNRRVISRGEFSLVFFFVGHIEYIKMKLQFSIQLFL